MKSKIILIFLSFALLTFGCSTSNLKMSKSSLLSMDQMKNEIYYSCISAIWLTTYEQLGLKQDGSLKVYLNDKMNKSFNVGKINIGNYTLNPDSGNHYNSSRFDPLAPIKSTDIIGMAGTQIPISIEGNETLGIKSISTNIYSPAMIKILTPAKGRREIIKGQDIDLTWIPDKGGKTMILELQADYNPYHKSKDSLDHFNTTVEDNGHCTIPWSILNQFNQKRTLKITLYRYNKSIVKTSDKKIAIVAYSRYFIGAYTYAIQ